MKIKFLSILLVGGLFLGACNSKKSDGGSASGDDDSEKTEATKKVTKRRYFINEQNSYSNFFFDSASLTKYFADNKVSDSLTRRMISFYNNRNYQYAWFTQTGPTEQARGFWNMYEYYLSYEPDKVVEDAPLKKDMDRYTASDDTDWSGRQKNLLNTELKLTEHFIRFYLANVDKGFIKRKEMEKFVPYVRQSAVEIADSLITKKHKDDKYYEDINKNYGNLKGYLEKYLAVQKAGGWPMVTASPKELKSKAASPNVAVLKKRLIMSGDLPSYDTTANWSDTLTTAIQQFQSRHGYTASGELTEQQLADMNIPVERRIEQLLINMGRTQWIIDQPKGRFIMVNIPEFVLHVSENGKKVFDMPVVVGKQGHNTMMFTGNLNTVVFSPYWNVPVSIVEKEIMPAIEKNPGYLASHNMEINGSLGNGLPAIRQLPGPDNSLGKVKFLFPNSFDIYFHDTPAKSLFSKDKRAYSHGCIRLSEPKKMAEYLLQNDSKWSSGAIDNAMNSGEEQHVKLSNPVPVLITYYTAWVDEQGMLHFAGDVYGHDKQQALKMFM
jgi:murein L,D-transpeptidase YcbB/YkuD